VNRREVDNKTEQKHIYFTQVTFIVNKVKTIISHTTPYLFTHSLPFLHVLYITHDVCRKHVMAPKLLSPQLDIRTEDERKKNS